MNSHLSMAFPGTPFSPQDASVSMSTIHPMQDDIFAQLLLPHVHDLPLDAPPISSFTDDYNQCDSMPLVPQYVEFFDSTSFTSLLPPFTPNFIPHHDFDILPVDYFAFPLPAHLTSGFPSHVLPSPPVTPMDRDFSLHKDYPNAFFGFQFPVSYHDPTLIATQSVSTSLDESPIQALCHSDSSLASLPALPNQRLDSKAMKLHRRRQATIPPVDPYPGCVNQASNHAAKLESKPQLPSSLSPHLEAITQFYKEFIDINEPSSSSIACESTPPASTPPIDDQLSSMIPNIDNPTLPSTSSNPAPIKQSKSTSKTSKKTNAKNRSNKSTKRSRQLKKQTPKLQKAKLKKHITNAIKKSI
ncbi:hypothetical protein BKA69DRAFT_1066332 [Paraphysoderma sedebokerense]|nr:hypothetical protein BKA69DRAFT_1066332 [Paraphysoderma sedebokerense]